MKKIYFSPEFEIVDFAMEAPLLSDSDIVGGGINDDNSISSDTTPSEDPAGDFGW